MLKELKSKINSYHSIRKKLENNNSKDSAIIKMPLNEHFQDSTINFQDLQPSIDNSKNQNIFTKKGELCNNEYISNLGWVKEKMNNDFLLNSINYISKSTKEKIFAFNSEDRISGYKQQRKIIRF